MVAESIMLLQILFPIVAGLVILFRPFFPTHKRRLIFISVSLCISLAFVIIGLFSKQETVTYFRLSSSISLTLCNDGLAKAFGLLVAVIWLFAGAFSFSYLRKTGKTNVFYASFLISEGILQAIALAGNLITFYMFFEWMTVFTFPLVLQNRTKEAVRAARKYFFYSIAGASFCLVGLFLLSVNTDGLSFQGGLSESADSTMVLIAAAFLLFGFGTKAGMFPMHGWLPVAHPVAPAPASAVLSGIITKVGVLGIIRTVYYVIGVENLRGTWFQILFLSTSLITVFMGSMLAFKEKILKKRLAYSTVSQVSYVLFGLALMTPEGFLAAMVHLFAHAITKVCLFLFSGIVIHETGKERVDGLKGIGTLMPAGLWCFTFASLGLIGIPPFAGFYSKWYLAIAALSCENLWFFRYLGPAVLLVSALLTAGYLLPIVADGFFPGKDFVFHKETAANHESKKEGGPVMFVPVAILAIAVLVLGIFAEPIYNVLRDLISISAICG